MIESHLQEGRQDIVPGQPLKRGVSVTDACISLAQTVPVLQRPLGAVTTFAPAGNAPGLAVSGPTSTRSTGAPAAWRSLSTKKLSELAAYKAIDQ
jgi:hypothetical protein